MFLLDRVKRDKTSRPFVFLKVTPVFVFLWLLLGSAASAQCVVPLLNNTVELKPAVCAATVGYLQGSTPLGGSGTYSYQWQQSTAANCAAYVNIGSSAGGNKKDYMIPATDAPGLCYRRVVNSGTGCSNTSNSIQVNAADRTTPVAPTVNVIQPSCFLNTGTISVTSPAPAAGIAYTVTGTAYSNTNPAGVFTTLAPSTYSVTAEFSTGCSSPALSVLLNVPLVSGSISPAAATICSTDSQTLTVTGGASYQWFLNNQPIVGATGNTYNAKLAGTYTATIKNGLCSGPASNSAVITVVAPPTGTITPATATVCAGNSALLTATGGGTYQWFRNDILLNGATASTYAATVSGVYSVRLNNNVCSAFVGTKATVTVVAAPTGSITPLNPTICAGSSQLLSTSGGTQYQWFRDGAPVIGATGSTYSTNVAGIYTVDIFNSAGCRARAQNTSTITVRPLPTGSISPATVSLCTNASAVIKTTGGATYQWYRNGGAVGNQTADSTITVSQAGTYAVEIFDAFGCQGMASNESVVSVTTLAAAASNVTNASCGQVNGAVTVRATGGTGSYTFSLNGGGLQNTGTFSGLAVGPHTVTVKDGAGCTVTVSFDVKQLFGIPNLVVTNPAKICPGTTANLEATAVTAGSDAGLSFSYWKDANATAPLTASKAATEGTYYIKGTNGGGCFTVKPVVVTAQTVFPGSITVGRTTACFTDSLPLTASGGVSYTWLRDGLAITGANLRNYDAKQSGLYSVLINDGTCDVKASNTVRLEFQPCTPIFDPRALVPTAFTPNRNGVNDRLRPIFYNVATLTFFKVFNRWGQQVFATATIGRGWDGTKDGIPQPPETYSWVLECVGKNGEVVKQSGRSVLIR